MTGGQTFKDRAVIRGRLQLAVFVTQFTINTNHLNCNLDFLHFDCIPSIGGGHAMSWFPVPRGKFAGVLQDIKSLTREELETQFAAWQQPKYRVAQLLRMALVHRVTSWEANDQPAQAAPRTIAGRTFRSKHRTLRKQGAPDPSSVAAPALHRSTWPPWQATTKSTLRRVKLQRVDTTQKFLWAATDHSLIESVLIPANPALLRDASDRHTLCVSTRSAAPTAANSAPAASDGLKRNLTPDEIIEQVMSVERLGPQSTVRSPVVRSTPPTGDCKLRLWTTSSSWNGRAAAN